MGEEFEKNQELMPTQPWIPSWFMWTVFLMEPPDAPLNFIIRNFTYGKFNYYTLKP